MNIKIDGVRKQKKKPPVTIPFTLDTFQTYSETRIQNNNTNTLT